MAVTHPEHQTASSELLRDKSILRQHVEEVVGMTPVTDVHTHIFPPRFHGLCLYGIDELLTYHYLVAEIFRSVDVAPERFWQMSKVQQADLVWKTLFVDNTPLSEAARGIVTVLDAFGLDPRSPDLDEARAFFASRELSDHVDQALDMARVSDLVMTNDPLDEEEVRWWGDGPKPDRRFHSSLRLDGLVNDWPNAARKLAGQYLRVDEELSGRAAGEVRRFLGEWIARIEPCYMAVSLPAGFRFPSDDARGRLISEVVLPIAREHNLALTLMMGVRRGVNPALRSAGDGLGRADVTALERLCGENPDVRFLATFLSLENQHELCVCARKFGNLMPFGCWWFLNNPSLVSGITQERLELLGPTFIPQHSDARVLEQLIYKWRHSRSVLAEALFEVYARLLESGRAVTRDEIGRDVSRMFSGNFSEWVGSSGPR